MKLQMIDGRLHYGMSGWFLDDKGHEVPSSSWAPVAFNNDAGAVVCALNPECEPFATYSQCGIVPTDSTETKVQKFLRFTGLLAPVSTEDYARIPFLGVANAGE